MLKVYHHLIWVGSRQWGLLSITGLHKKILNIVMIYVGQQYPTVNHIALQNMRCAGWSYSCRKIANLKSDRHGFDSHFRKTALHWVLKCSTFSPCKLLTEQRFWAPAGRPRKISVGATVSSHLAKNNAFGISQWIIIRQLRPAESTLPRTHCSICARLCSHDYLLWGSL